MSETIDLTLLSGSLQALEREVRLLRMQIDQLVGTLPPRLGGIDGRLGVMEQSFHDLAAEVARDFGQVQQQSLRTEKRFDALDAGLASLRRELAESTEQIKRAITGAVD